MRRELYDVQKRKQWLPVGWALESGRKYGLRYTDVDHMLFGRQNRRPCTRVHLRHRVVSHARTRMRMSWQAKEPQEAAATRAGVLRQHEQAGDAHQGLPR